MQEFGHDGLRRDQGRTEAPAGAGSMNPGEDPQRWLESIPREEIDLSYVRAQGPGGQNLNKVATAVHLRFDIRASSLPEDTKERLLALGDGRMTRDGVLVIKSQNHRSQGRNQAVALERLAALVASVANPPKARRPTRPSAGARRQRLDAKIRRGRLKALRSTVSE